MVRPNFTLQRQMRSQVRCNTFYRSWGNHWNYIKYIIHYIVTLCFIRIFNLQGDQPSLKIQRYAIIICQLPWSQVPSSFHIIFERWELENRFNVQSFIFILITTDVFRLMTIITIGNPKSLRIWNLLTKLNSV